jgi:hypothetical protein
MEEIRKLLFEIRQTNNAREAVTCRLSTNMRGIADRERERKEKD